MRPDHLIVLAGGQATRLGPITATMSKALVTVGSKPMIVHQILGLDPRRVTVVTAPTNSRQVEDLVKRTFGPDLTPKIIVQTHPQGPVDAVRLGLQAAHDAEHTMIIMADSLYDFTEVGVLLGDDVDWVSVTTGSQRLRRSYCWFRDIWYDGEGWGPDDYIFTGLISTRDPMKWYGAAGDVLSFGLQANDEIGMSQLLGQMQPQTRELTWHDTGDVPALAATTRELFIKRDHHQVGIDDLGRLHKTGCSPEQLRYLENLHINVKPLFPRVFEIHDDTAIMEFIDLPSLAELWLYWPATTDLWQHIVGRVIDIVYEHLWPDHMLTGDPVVRSQAMLIDKLIERTKDMHHLVGVTRVEHLIDRLKPIVHNPITGFIHGDLNFTNILYSARTDTFKLLDPRGAWGDDTGLGDVRYDLAKLRYSWRGFVTTVHGLGSARQDPAIGHALDQVIIDRMPDGRVTLSDLAAIEASMFFSALPLHPIEQRSHLVAAGVRCFEEAMR